LTAPKSEGYNRRRMITPAEFFKGFYDWERQDVVPFRWLSREGELRVRLPETAGPRLLLVVARHAFPGQPAPALEVLVDGGLAGRAQVPGEFRTMLFPFRADGNVTLIFRLDRVYQAPGDNRILGVMVRKAVVLSVEEFDDPEFGAGWYDSEEDNFVSFRWMGLYGDILLPSRRVRSHRYLEMSVFSDFYDSGQVLTVSNRGRILAEWPLIRGWGRYGLELAALREAALEGEDDAPLLELRLNKLHPARHHPGDARELGARLGALEFHDDRARHEAARFFRDNARLNFEEMKAGKTVLSSYPLTLGIDLFGRCNISPPCVYCLWDRMKEMESGHVDDVVDDRTLEGYGPFFRSARSLVNCSFGEPLLHPRLAEVLELAARTNKTVELSTNGQAFTARTIKALVGKPVNLYVSLDAASRETYAKIRNDRWDEIIPLLLRLNEERKKAGGLPRLFMVFIPMRVNAGDLEAYFELARRVDADRLVLRPLLYLGQPEIRRERGGYLFDYEKEMLSREELEVLFQEAGRLSRRLGVPLVSQFDFGKYDEAPVVGGRTP